MCPVSDTIKCTCSHCGAKYRLPLEAQGRSARCKRCGEKFEIPRQSNSLEDSVLSWLSAVDEEEEDVAVKPRVISMPNDPSHDSEAGRKLRGPIRMKSEEKPS